MFPAEEHTAFHILMRGITQECWIVNSDGKGGFGGKKLKLYMSYKYLLYQNNLLESTFDFLNDSL